MNKMANSEEAKLYSFQDKIEQLQKRQLTFERVICFCVLGIFLIEVLVFFNLQSSIANERKHASTSLQDLEMKLHELKSNWKKFNDIAISGSIGSLEKGQIRNRRSLKKNTLIYRTIDFLFNQKPPSGCLQNASIICLPGKEGSAGPAGPRGAPGLKGDSGQPGVKGKKGNPGFLGIPGMNGKPGKRGEKGSPGPIGFNGEIGLPGPKGAKGFKGDTGQVGPPGVKGSRGHFGPHGPKGDRGDRGAAGPSFQKPVIINGPKSMTVRRNATLRFSCEAEGNPNPRIYWYLNGKRIQDEHARFHQENTTLVLTEVVEEDQGVVTCFAESVLGKTEASAQLLVLTPPGVELDPHIPRYLTVDYGSDVELLCNVTGYPKPKVVWEKLGSAVSLNENSTNSGRLTLKSVNKKDSGLYRCVAMNSVGKASGNVLLFVKESYRDCKQLFEEGYTNSSIYVIKPDNKPPFRVYCDMKTSGGGWVIFQRRNDSSTSFSRNWEAYKNGFGKLDGNFWLGLDKIHRLTKASSSLRIDLSRGGRGESSRYRYRNHYYAYYNDFMVADESENYRLIVTDYRGNAGDSLSYHSEMPFSTYDRDNDRHGSINCASEQGGAWWHNSCQYSALNAQFPAKFSASSNKFMTWYTRGNRFGDADFAEMKLRRRF